MGTGRRDRTVDRSAQIRAIDGIGPRTRLPTIMSFIASSNWLRVASAGGPPSHSARRVRSVVMVPRAGGSARSEVVPRPTPAVPETAPSGRLPSGSPRLSAGMFHASQWRTSSAPVNATSRSWKMTAKLTVPSGIFENVNPGRTLPPRPAYRSGMIPPSSKASVFISRGGISPPPRPPRPPRRPPRA